MTGNPRTIGPAGQALAAHLRRMRGWMPLTVCAASMAEHGGPVLSPVALGRIERGERAVDVDELVAFARIFGVSPLVLLDMEDGK